MGPNADVDLKLIFRKDKVLRLPPYHCNINGMSAHERNVTPSVSSARFCRNVYMTLMLISGRSV